MENTYKCLNGSSRKNKKNKLYALHFFLTNFILLYP